MAFNEPTEFNRTLLIVADDPLALKSYQELLGDQSGPAAAERYSLLVASSAQEASERVKQEQKAGRGVAAGFLDLRREGGSVAAVEALRALLTLDVEAHYTLVLSRGGVSADEIRRRLGDAPEDRWDLLERVPTREEIVQKARRMTRARNRSRELASKEDQLVRAERLIAIGQVARGVGHELGNILLRIMGKTDLALMEKDVTKIHSHLEVVMSSAERAGGIVRNLQSFSNTAPKLKSGQVSAPIENALALVAPDLANASVRVDKSLGAVPPILMDSGALSQVFYNLYLNAAHAMSGGGGQLSVTVAEAPGPPRGIEVKVADTGTGISPQALPRIFDFAFTTKGDRGTGLGLSISLELVRAHGGRIDVATETGKGTEFTVWLPA